MKKNVIRLTESELKQYIGKVVAEQTAPGAVNVEAEKQKANAVRASVAGKNVQLYLDPSKTKKSHIVNVVGVGFSQNQPGVYWVTVKDLSFVTDTGGQMDPQDGTTPITHLRFDCTQPDELYAQGASGGKNVGVVYCPPFTEMLKQGFACKTVNRTPDLASAGKPGVQSNMAETVRVDIG
jgi:hypothetical protein